VTPSDPLPTGWFGTDLGPYRGADGTYGLFLGDATARGPDFDGTFGWLPPRASAQPGDGAEFGGADLADDEDVDYMQPVTPAASVALARISGLPPSFVYFLSHPELTGAIPTCTLCYWNVADDPVPSPLADGARLLGFMNDQQDVLLWYLYLMPDGGHRVVCGSIPYHDTTVDAQQAAQDLVQVAPDFESFVYRFWVENLAWYELNQFGFTDAQLSPAVRQYLSRYPETGHAG
jgi:hypothetical protein